MSTGVSKILPNISLTTISSILLPSPSPNLLDNFIAALLMKSGVHSIRVAFDVVLVVTLSCMSYMI